MTGTMSGTDDSSLKRMAQEILRLQSQASQPLRRIQVRHGESSLEVEWAEAALPGEIPVAEPVGAVEDGRSVRAPVVGTFYRKPEPGAPAFAEPGDVVEAGQQIGIVEAMKVMNVVTAPESGRVREFLAGDGELVEFDQPLAVLDPVAVAR